MTGYAVRARIEHVEVHPVAAADEAGGVPPAAAATPSVEEPERRRARWRIALEDVRTVWSQTTFYLFDPQSWR